MVIERLALPAWLTCISSGLLACPTMVVCCNLVWAAVALSGDVFSPPGKARYVAQCFSVSAHKFALMANNTSFQDKPP